MSGGDQQVHSMLGASRVRLAPLLPAVLAIAALLAYLPALSAGFVWDDDEYLWRNPLIAGGIDTAGPGDLELLRDIWIPRFTPYYHPNTPQYYPVVFTTFWIEHRLYPSDAAHGTDPTGYHVVNLLLHVTNALLIVLLARRIHLTPAVAWSIAFVFALHPVHVESVAWVTERKNVLSTSFYLLAAISYFRFDLNRVQAWAAMTPSSDTDGRPKRIWGWYILAFLLFLLALLSKSVSASLPVAIVIFLLMRRERLSWARLWPLAPMLLLGAAAGLHTGFLERTHVGAVGPDWEFSLVERIVIASRALLFYPWKIVAPINLAFIYPRWVIDAQDLLHWIPLVVEAALVSVCLWLWWRRDVRWLLLGCVYFAVSIFPALGFANIYPMRFSFVADHFQYLASLGIIALFVGLLAQLLRRQLVFVSAMAVICVALATMSHRHARLYQDQITFYESIVHANPSAWMAHSNLARAMIDRATAARDRSDDEAFAVAIAAAENHARAATGIRPENERGWTNLAEALRLQGRLHEAIEALQSGIDALTREREWLTQHDYQVKVLWAEYHLAIDYGSLARLHNAAGDTEAAIKAFETALAIVPQDRGTARLRLNLHSSLADLLTQLDRLAEAAPHYEYVLGVHPDDLLAHLVLGEHARREGRYGEAKSHFTAALQVVNNRDEELQAAYRLGWLCATAKNDAVRDGRYAVLVGERMIQATGATSPDAFDLYAAALAEIGRYEDAVKTAEEALKLTAAHNLADLHARIEARLALYRTGQPFRE